MKPNERSLVEKTNSLDLKIGERKLSIHRGDILSLTADALVCPVDAALDFRTGLAQVVMQAAGKNAGRHKPLMPEPYGKVVVLPGGNLKVKYIFLTILLGEKGLDKMRLSIQEAVNRAIHYAEFLRLKSIAFPVLGSPETTPPYSFIAHEMLEHIQLFFQKRHTRLQAILLSAYNAEAFKAFQKEARDIVDN